MKDRTIVRCPKGTEAPFFAISRALAQDVNLSWEARGMMLYLLSKPDDWIVQVNDLKQQCGRDKVYKILDELVKARYMTRTEKKKRSNGTYEPVVYMVYEQPLTEKPEVDTPLPGNPDTVLPYTVEPTLQNTEVTEYRLEAEAPQKETTVIGSVQSTLDPEQIVQTWLKAAAKYAPLGYDHARCVEAAKDLPASYPTLTLDDVRACTLAQCKNRTSDYLFSYLLKDLVGYMARKAIEPPKPKQGLDDFSKARLEMMREEKARLKEGA